MDKIKLMQTLAAYDLTPEVVSRLSILLDNTIKGSNDIYVSPIIKNIDPVTLSKELNSLILANRDKINDVLFDMECSNRDKFGPRSIAIPWKERIKGVDSYFIEQNNVDYNLFNINLLDNKVKSTLRPLSLSNASKFLKNNTNSGLPFYTRKGKVKDKVLKDFNFYLDKQYPCVLFTRTQEQEKTRPVFGFPIADTLNEMRYYRPLLDYQKNLVWRSALAGPDKVSKDITRLILTAIKLKLRLVSVDFSAYDATVKTGIQNECFKYIKALFQAQNGSEIDYIFHRFNTIGLLTPDGIKSGSHGVPSGSTFTNEVDSIAQYLIAKTVEGIDDNLINIQGDDGVYAIPEDLVEKLYHNFDHYGLNINEAKGSNSDNYVIYLQNLFHIDYMKEGLIGGIYPLNRALNRIIYQERWNDFEKYGLEGKDFYAIRTISILENCKYHPLFEDFVKMIIKYDKYSLRVTDEGLRKYIDMLVSKEGSEGIVDNQYGDKIRGIKNFESFKLIRKLVH